MSKYKLSPWHDGSVPPVHVGVYKIKCGCSFCEFTVDWYSKWNGKEFCSVMPSINEAELQVVKDVWINKFKWRGILKD